MIDLTELMEHRSDGRGMPAGQRLALVQRRIRRRRAGRLAGAGVGLLALVVGGWALVPAGSSAPPGRNAADRPTASAATSPSPSAVASAVPGGNVGPFAEYADGYRVVAVGSAPVTAGQASVAWTVGSTDVQLFSYCPGLGDRNLSLDGEFTVNGTPRASLNCIGDLQQDVNDSAPNRIAQTLVAGEKATITYTITGAWDMAKARNASLPKQGTVYLAVAERVPFTQYPLPARPDKLVTPMPDSAGTGPGGQLVRSDPADPGKPQTATIVWKYGYNLTLSVTTSTPGIYTIAIDGATVATREVYDYRGGGGGPSCSITNDGTHCLVPSLGHIADGQTVTVTFTAQYASGPWLGEVRMTPTIPNGQG